MNSIISVPHFCQKADSICSRERHLHRWLRPGECALMPMTLAPISRRRFLAGSVAAGVGAMLGRRLYADDGAADPHRFALLSDTHIAADPRKIERGVVMYNHMRHVSNELLELTDRPGTIFVNGDCAFGTGETGDYLRFLELIRPLREAGYP